MKLRDTTIDFERVCCPNELLKQYGTREIHVTERWQCPVCLEWWNLVIMETGGAKWVTNKELEEV